MNAASEPEDGVPLCGNFVLLRTGRIQVLLPRQEVLDATHFGGEAHGRPDAREVVALSDDLRPLAEVPEERFVLTRLAGSDALLAWDAVRVLIASKLRRRLLPPALRTPGSPVDGFVEIDGAPVLCSNAAALLAYAFNEKV